MATIIVNLNVSAPDLSAALLKLAEAIGGKTTCVCANAENNTANLVGANTANLVKSDTTTAVNVDTANLTAGNTTNTMNVDTANLANLPTLPAIMKACSDLVDAGKQEVLLEILESLNTPSVPVSMLPPAQLSMFVEEIKKMGAVL